MNLPSVPAIDLVMESAPQLLLVKMKVGEVPVLCELATNLASLVNPCVLLSRTKRMSLKFASVMVASIAKVPGGWLTLDVKVLPLITEIGL
jgi:hypothetical protein